MKIVIFGATGKVGRNITKQALEQGHEVTAFVRNAHTANLGDHANLRLVVGDVLNERDVEAAVEAQDAVLVAIGKPLRNKEGLRAKGTANVIAAMQKTGPKRLICLSGLGAGDSYAILPRLYRYFILPVILKHVYADHEKQEALVRNSGLDWTLVRPANLTEGERTNDYHFGFDRLEKSMSLKITYGDVADFMLRQVNDRRYLHAAPALTA